MLLDAGLCDHAYHLAWRAGVSMLTARHCHKHGIWRFAWDSDAVAGFTHSTLNADMLEALTTLDEGPVRAAPAPLDWTQLNAHQEPAARREIGRDDVTSFVAGMHNLVAQLVLFEVVERLIQVEVEVSERYGPFSLFALARGAAGPADWGVVTSASWLERHPTEPRPELRHLTEMIETVLDGDLRAHVKRTTVLASGDPLLRPYQRLPSTRHRVLYTIEDHASDDVVLPKAYVITNLLGAISAD